MLRVAKFFTSVLALTLLFGIAANAQDLKSAIRLSESEQFDVAHKAFDDLITKDPANGEVYYYYGESWLNQYMVDSNAVSLSEACASALKYFTMGTEKVPGEPLNFIGAGRVDVLLGKYSDAEVNFQKAKNLMPLQGMKYNKSAIPVAKQALAYAKIAEAYLHNPGKTKEDLLAIIDNAIERDASVPEVYIIKGDIYKNFSLNDLSPAIAAYNKANDLDPKSCKAMVKIGQVWVRGAAYSEALEFYKNAIAIDSTFAPAYRERGDLWGIAKQWENGIKDYNKFLELSGNNFYAKVRYASFLHMAEKHEDAIKVIQELKATDSEAINKTYNYINRLEARSYFSIGKNAEALQTIELFFKNAASGKIIADDYFYYGKILSKGGNDSLAIEKFLKATEMDPANCDVLSELAKSYTKMKNFVQAIKVYEKKNANNCITVTDLYEMGKTCYFDKQYVKADSVLNIVLTKKPDYLPALKYIAWTNANIDTTSVLGKAKPYYETIISYGIKTDSVKYIKDISEGYGYLMYYYFKQYNMNDKCEDAKSSLAYCEKMLAIDPKNEKALTIKKSLTGKCP